MHEYHLSCYIVILYTNGRRECEDCKSKHICNTNLAFLSEENTLLLKNNLSLRDMVKIQLILHYQVIGHQWFMSFVKAKRQKIWYNKYIFYSLEYILVNVSKMITHGFFIFLFQTEKFLKVKLSQFRYIYFKLTMMAVLAILQEDSFEKPSSH